MCGICGIFHYGSGQAVDRWLLEKMCNVITHRGPDEQGIFVDNNIGLGNRRLSIIDLENGTQPIANEDNTIFVILNGEIYNFPELRLKLAAKGHKFRTRTDTETIVHLYEEKGIECLLDLNGMFAVAIWDARSHELFLARDRIGIKPLHYSIQDGSLYFGSEIKSILQNRKINTKVDESALAEYLSWLYIPAPRTIYEKVKKLLPGRYLHAKDGSVQIHRYWSFEMSPQNGKSEKQLCDELEYKFDSAIARQMISDVPLGAFLSGGIDSSMVVSSMAKTNSETIKTFTVGFDHKGCDERLYARRVAEWLASEHHELAINPKALNNLPELLWYYDEPFADEAALPTYYLSQSARQTVRVALSGEGADELFAGYRVYQTERLQRWYANLPKQIRNVILSGLARISDLNWSDKMQDLFSWLHNGLRLTDMVAEERYLSKLAIFAADFQQTLLQKKPDVEPYESLVTLFNGSSYTDFLEKLLSAGMNFNLPNKMLTKIDRASMAASLEVRVPFLDNEIVDFAATLPLNMKFRGLTTKHIVKKVLARRLPQNLYRRPKHGLDVPFKQWFREDLIQAARHYLRKDLLNKQGIFNADVVEKILKSHELGYNNNARQIYGLTVFQIWYNTIYNRDAVIGR